jgi:hypothetical protein
MSYITAFPEPLFRVKTTMPVYGHLKDVTFYWFYYEKTTTRRRQALYKVLIEGYDVKDEYIFYPECAIDELFSADEAAALKAYLDAVRGDAATTVIRPIELPIPNNMTGFGTFGTDSWRDVYGTYNGSDYYMLSEDSEYNLPFKVWGWFKWKGVPLAAAVAMGLYFWNPRRPATGKLA